MHFQYHTTRPHATISATLTWLLSLLLLLAASQRDMSLSTPANSTCQHLMAVSMIFANCCCAGCSFGGSRRSPAPRCRVLEIWVVCPQNGTGVPEGVHRWVSFRVSPLCINALPGNFYHEYCRYIGCRNATGRRFPSNLHWLSFMVTWMFVLFQGDPGRGRGSGPRRGR